MGRDRDKQNSHPPISMSRVYPRRRSYIGLRTFFSLRYDYVAEGITMLILDQDELLKLTGKAQKQAQCKVLRRMGIKFAERLDGWPIVTREAVLEYTGVSSERGMPETATMEWN